MSDDLREALAEALRATDPEPYMPGNWEDAAYYRGFADALLASDAVARIKAEARAEGADHEFQQRLGYGIEAGSLVPYVYERGKHEGAAEVRARVEAECQRLAQSADKYDQAEQWEYAGGLREAAHHLLAALDGADQ